MATEEKQYLLLNKKNKYTREMLDKAIELLDQKLHPQEIADQIDGFSATQIKKIRLILKVGDNDDIAAMKECKYYLSSIKKDMQWRKRRNKKLQKKKQNELERGASKKPSSSKNAEWAKKAKDHRDRQVAKANNER